VPLRAAREFSPIPVDAPVISATGRLHVGHDLFDDFLHDDSLRAYFG
jgi:hypothetical protein